MKENVDSGTWSLKKSHYEGFSILVRENDTDYRTCNICFLAFSSKSVESIRYLFFKFKI